MQVKAKGSNRIIKGIARTCFGPGEVNFQTTFALLAGKNFQELITLTTSQTSSASADPSRTAEPVPSLSTTGTMVPLPSSISTARTSQLAAPPLEAQVVAAPPGPVTAQVLEVVRPEAAALDALRGLFVRAASLDGDASNISPEEFKAFVGEEIARWKQVIIAADIKVE